MLTNDVEWFPIEQDVPISADRTNSQRHKWNTKMFPFNKMQIGDSFVARPPAGEELIYTQNAVSGAGCVYARKRAISHPDEPRRVFTTRQQFGVQVRCWRIA